MSTGDQTSSWARKNSVRGFLGVFPSDELPEHVPKKKRWCLVTNVEGHSSPGDHWLAVIGEGGQSFFFNMHGIPPDQSAGILGDEHAHFRRWLSQHSPNGSSCSETALQGFGSDVCGERSVYACKYGMPAINPEAWHWATSSRKKNDAVIARLVKFKSDPR